MMKKLENILKLINSRYKMEDKLDVSLLDYKWGNCEKFSLANALSYMNFDKYIHCIIQYEWKEYSAMEFEGIADIFNKLDKCEYFECSQEKNIFWCFDRIFTCYKECPFNVYL